MHTPLLDLFETFLLALFCIAIGFGLGWQTKTYNRCNCTLDNDDPEDWWKHGDPPPPYGAA